MSIQKMIVDYAKYNHWANEKLSQWLRSLERGLLYKPTPSSFASIGLTIRHMQESQQFWLGIITKEDPIAKKDLIVKADPASPRGADNDIADFSLLLKGSRLMLDKFGAYTEEELLEKVTSTDMTQSRYEFILHIINHNSYHRGQIVTMCRQLGAVDNIPAMDYEAFLWSSL
jgi:uncharacterized damage-inducible protein DinB